MLILRLLLIALLPAMIGVAPTAAFTQNSAEWDAERAHISRADLQNLLTRLEEAAASTAYSDGLRTRARYSAALVRERLEEGDLQAGDQINVVVQGRPEFSDSVTVTAGRTAVLPTIGTVPLRGILRSELESYLGAYIGRFLRDPVVYASSSIRLMIAGGVGAPGFYSVAAETPVSEVLMAAGGIAAAGELRGIRIERKQVTVAQGPALEAAITEGQTVDELNLRTGDRIVVPAEAASRLGGISLATAVPMLLYLVSSLGQVF